MDVTNYIGVLLPVLLSILNTVCCEKENCTAIWTENGVRKTKVSECHAGCCGDTEVRHCCLIKVADDDADAHTKSWVWVSTVISTVFVLIAITVAVVLRATRWRMMQRNIENQRRQNVPVIQMHNSSQPPPTYNEATTQQNYPGLQTNSGQQNNYYASKDYKMGPKGYPVQSSFPPTYSAFGGANPS